MFGYLGNATIKNLKIENATVKTSGCSGLLANESSGTALKIENCSVSGNVGGIDTGGFIGKCVNVTFTDCNSSARVSYSGFAGGFVGSLSGEYSFTRCSRNNSITSSQYAAGGFISCAYYSSANNSFTDCCTINSVDGYGYAGGFIGISNSAFIMRNCYKTGYIDMNEYWSQETYAGADDIIIKNRNTVRLKPELVDCDYYEYLKGNLSSVNTYQGEYMHQYSWAEMTTAVLPVVDKNNI